MVVSDLPVRERLRLAEANMDTFLDIAHGPEKPPQASDLAYRRAAEWAVIAMELRSRLAFQ